MMMNELVMLKSKVENLFKTCPNVHMDLSLKTERIYLTNVSADITAVYPNLFEVMVHEDNGVKKHIFQYVDLLTKNVKIKELEM